MYGIIIGSTDECQNGDASIRVNCDPRSNHNDECDRHDEKHDEQRS
jgi:hypothetical protein